MSLIGKGAVAIWHDIEPQGRDAFYAWHGEEHMPERVGIAGFTRGRRYIAVDADLEFFNLYEARTPDVVRGPDYQERLNNPTPWTIATVKHFQNVSRSICRVAATFGRGQGGLVATWRYDVADEKSQDHIARLTAQDLPDLAGNPLIAGVHLLVADAEASAVDTVERQARAGKNRIPRWILMVEGWGDAPAFAALCRSALSDPVLAGAGASGPVEFGLYQLQVSLAASDD